MKPEPSISSAAGQAVNNRMKRTASDQYGRIPEFRPTQEQRQLVMVLAANGVLKPVIATILGINLKTLDRHLRNELREGWAQITARIGASLVKEALAGNVAAARFWLTVHGGWRVPKDAYQPDHDETEREETVVFYIPTNGRDKPEEGITIDGQAEDNDDTDAAA
jgi:hypothetical protein